MAGFNFATKADFDRMRRVVQSVERDVANLRLHRRPKGRSIDTLGWIPIYNGGSDDIPAYGIMRLLTGGPKNPNARRAIYCAKPDAPFARLDSHLINGPVVVPAGDMGWAQPYPPYTVLYDSGNTPAFGESWGPVNASYKATKRSAGYYVLGIVSSTDTTMLVMPNPFFTGKGRLDGDLATASSATCSVYDESGDTTYNLTVYDDDPAFLTTSFELVTGVDVAFAWMATHRQYHVISSDTCESAV